jgi:hypothetical protein
VERLRPGLDLGRPTLQPCSPTASSAPASKTFDVALEFGAGESLGSPQLPGFSPSVDELLKR